MKLLIIEDDINKQNAICSFIAKRTNFDYDTCSSYHSGLKTLLKEEYDLLLLDMSMPVYDATAQEMGGRPLALAGRDILFQIRRRKSSLRVIIVTQYESFDGLSLSSLKDNLKKEFPNNYLESVYYSITQDTWQEELETLLRNYYGDEVLK